MGFVQGGTVIRDGDNLMIQGLSPSGIAVAGQVIYQKMPWSLIASAQISVPVTTLQMNTTGANLIVITVVYGQPAVAAITDSLSNLWTQGVDATIFPRSTIYYCINPMTGNTHNFNLSAGGASSFNVLAFAGSNSISADQTSIATSSGVTHIQLNPLTPSAMNSLVIAAVTNEGNILSIDSGFTIIENIAYINGVQYGGATAYLVQKTTASLAPTWTLATAGRTAATMLSFKPS